MKRRVLMFALACVAVPAVASAQFGKIKIATPSREEVEVKGLWKPIKAKIDDLIEKLKAIAEAKAKELAATLIKKLADHVVTVDASIEKKQWAAAKKKIEAGGTLATEVAAEAKDVLAAAGESLQVIGLWKVLKETLDGLLAKLKAIPGDLAKEPIGKIEAHAGKIDAAIGDKKWPDAKSLIEAGTKLAADIANDAKELLEKAKTLGEELVIKGLWDPLKATATDLLAKLKEIPTSDAKEYVEKIEPAVAKIDAAVGEKKWKDAKKLIGKLTDVAKDAAVEVAKALANKVLVDLVKKGIDGLRKKAEAFAERVRASADEKVKKWMKEVEELYKEAEEYAAKGKEKAKKRLKEVEEKFLEIEERLRKRAVDKLEEVEKDAKDRLKAFEAKVNEVKDAADAKARELRDQAYAALAEAEKAAEKEKEKARQKLKEAEDLVQKAIERGKTAVEEAKAALMKLQEEVSAKVLAEKQRLEKYSERLQATADEKAKAAWAELLALQKQAEELAQKGADEAKGVAAKVVDKAKEVEQIARDLGAKAMEFAKDRYDATQKKLEEMRAAADDKAKGLITTAEDLMRQAEDTAAKSKEEADALLKKAEAKVGEAAAHLKKIADAAKGIVEVAFGSAREAVQRLSGALGEQVVELAKSKALKKFVKTWQKHVKKGDETSSWLALATLKELVAAAVKANVLLPDKFKAEWEAIRDASQKEVEARLAKAGEHEGWFEVLVAKVTDKKILKLIKECRKSVVSFKAKVGIGNLKGWADWAKADKCIEKLKATGVPK